MVVQKPSLILLIVGIFWTSASGQPPIDIVESTFKIPAKSEKVFFYGFAKGDQIIFNFEVVKGKHLEEIEVIELPSYLKFADYKSKKIENKTLNISKESIYKFRLVNSGKRDRICKIRVQRIPGSIETSDFNSKVNWRTVYDTTYTTTTDQEEYLISKDTVVHNLTDRVESVPVFNPYGMTSFNFTLPTSTVAWSYYLGVNQEGQQAYKEAANELSTNPFVTALAGSDPLTAILFGFAPHIAKLISGQNVQYWIVRRDDVNGCFDNNESILYIKKGNVINDFSHMTTELIGMHHFCLANDNFIETIDVIVKVAAIAVTENWGTRPVKKMQITSREEPYLKN